jgi:hypothetical protein
MIYKQPIVFNTGVKLVHNTYWHDTLILPTERILDNFGRIYIPSKLWRELNTSYSRSAIKRLISRAILDHNIPMPLQHITEQQANRAFRRLKAFSSQGALKRAKLFSRFDYNFDISDYYIDTASTFNPASNYFHQYNRWLAGSAKHPSPYYGWTKARYHNTFLNNLWSLPRKKIDAGELNTAINLKFYVASQFKPQAAKVFYELFNAKTVLDLSSGWGDRLCGFCASTASSYTGLDPNTRLIEGYAKQIAMYGGTKDITMVCTGSEFYNPLDKRFDTIFTSPPYFAIEEYSTDSGQSFKQYNTFDAWCAKFLFPTLDMAWNALDDTNRDRGGVLCINISDIMIGIKRHRICDRMNQYLAKKIGAKYLGAIGLKLSLRPNIMFESQEEQRRNAVFIEPMWLWSKNGVWDLEDHIARGFKKERPRGLLG